MTHRLEGQLEYDPDTGGIFISLFPEPGEPEPSGQEIVDAVSDLVISGWENKIKHDRDLDS